MSTRINYEWKGDDTFEPFAAALGIEAEDILAVHKSDDRWLTIYTTDTMGPNMTAWVVLLAREGESFTLAGTPKEAPGVLDTLRKLGMLS